MGASLGLGGWLACCALWGGLGVSMSIRLFVFALGDCFLGAWWAGQLPRFWGAFAALFVSGCWLGVSSAVSAAVGCLGFGCRRGGWCFCPVGSSLLP